MKLLLGTIGKRIIHIQGSPVQQRTGDYALCGAILPACDFNIKPEPVTCDKCIDIFAHCNKGEINVKERRKKP